MSPAYNFYLNMWIMKKADEAFLLSKVPTKITQEEYDEIINTPQTTVV